MKVVHENNNIVAGMLKDELDRCESMVDSLQSAIRCLPKGSLHQRRSPAKKNGERVYHYLKYRDGKKSVYEHIPERKIDELKVNISERKRKEKKIKEYRDRIKYLHKLLKA